MRILIVEDHPMSAVGLCKAIGSEHGVAAILTSGDEVMPWLALNDVDLVLLDLSLPKRSGGDLLLAIRALPNPPRVLIVTMHDDPALRDELKRRGADGFIGKGVSMALLAQIIAEVAAGRTWFPDREAERNPKRRWSRWSPGMRITGRQYDVLRALADALSRKATAVLLGISEYTVDEHLAALRKVFAVDTNAAVVRAAIEHGFLPPFSLSEHKTPR